MKHKLLGYNYTDGLLFKLIVYILLFSVSYVFLFPLLKMISMSIMSKNDIINPEVDWIPQEFSFKSFSVATFVMNMPKTFLNSLWFSTTLSVFQTGVSATTGFAFARYNFKFKKIWFGLVLLTFIIPIPVVLIPRIMMFVTIQNTTGMQVIGTIIPQLFMTIFGQGIYSAILILIFYNFFKMIPIDLDEAARVDGATAFEVFWYIILQLSIPTIVTVFLFSFVWNWNETYITSTFVRSSIELLPIKLSIFDDAFQQVAQNIPGQAGEARINEAYKMAATFISMLPLLILYLFVQKQFVEGIESTGITGQ